jgi:molybdopterin-guanine dinucleotide biosynthesis protein B
MRVYGVIGWKNSGKTSLMERLVAEITGRGFSVSTVKHVHHDVDLDQPGKDTHRHRTAGAREVVLASRDRYALMVEHRGPEPDLAAVLSRMAPVDLILVEGYKRDAHRKLEVWRRETNHALIQTTDPLVRAVATDEDLALPVPVLNLNDTAAVADFILTETGLIGPHRIDTVTIVDWSASNGPARAPGENTIWIGTATTSGTTAQHFPTRAAAEAHLTGLIETERHAGRRLLIGCDFAMGYPTGFAQRLTGKADPRAVWAWLAQHVTDDGNVNNRFAVADRINAQLGQGPFWGRPGTLPLPNLPERKPAAHAFPEHRAAERAVKGAQPVWKLFTTGSVGGQSLTGLPMVHRLSHIPGTAVWPFDPTDTAATILAEVYPSLLRAAVARKVAQGWITDAAQVTLLARALLRLAQTNALGPLLQTPPDPRVAEEGWILGAGHAAALVAAAEDP